MPTSLMRISGRSDNQKSDKVRRGWSGSWKAVEFTWDWLSIVVWISSANHDDGKWRELRKIVYHRRVLRTEEQEGAVL